MNQKQRNRFYILFLWTSFFATSGVAHALDFRLGLSLGFGGGGTTTVEKLDGAPTEISRSEGPGTFGLTFEYLLNETVTLGVEHSRGFRIGPFSSGAKFTGINGKWFFWSPAPSMDRLKEERSFVLVQRFSPFAGLALGVASATIDREADLIPEVTASGVYVGIQLGADYQIAPGILLRPELKSYMTLISSTANPASLKFFTLGCGILFSF